MTDDAEKLAAHTHFDQETAEQLLDARSLSGDPSEHDFPAIIVTADEVVVETRSAFKRSSTIPSSIEVALTTGARVEQIRRGAAAAASLAEPPEDTQAE